VQELQLDRLRCNHKEITNIQNDAPVSRGRSKSSEPNLLTLHKLIKNTELSTFYSIENFNLLPPKPEAIVKIHQCCKIGENASDTFQETLLTTFQMDRRTDTQTLCHWTHYVGCRHKHDKVRRTIPQQLFFVTS